MLTGLVSLAAAGVLLAVPAFQPDSDTVASPAVDAAVSDATVAALESLPDTVVPIPGDITADCSVDVTAAISAWIRSVPDGSTMLFGSGDCYRVDYTIEMTDRHDIALDGNGASFEAVKLFPELPSSRHHMINMLGGSDIVIRDLTLEGNNPTPRFNRNRVWYHGVNVEGVDGLLLDGIRASNFWGDFMHIAEDGRGQGPEKHANNIVIENSSSNIVGRSQISCTACEHVLVKDSTFDNTGYQVFNIEVGYAAWHANDISFLRNSIGGYIHLSVLVNAGIGEYVRNVSFIGNTMTTDPLSCQAPVYVLDTEPAKSNFVFRDNNLRALGAGFRVSGVESVTIQDNSVLQLPGGMCKERGVAVRAKNTTGTVKHNHFDSFTAVTAERVANPRMVCGNRLSGADYNQPVPC